MWEANVSEVLKLKRSYFLFSWNVHFVSWNDMVSYPVLVLDTRMNEPDEIERRKEPNVRWPGPEQGWPGLAPQPRRPAPGPAARAHTHTHPGMRPRTHAPMHPCAHQ